MNEQIKELEQSIKQQKLMLRLLKAQQKTNRSKWETKPGKFCLSTVKAITQPFTNLNSKIVQLISDPKAKARHTWIMATSEALLNATLIPDRRGSPQQLNELSKLALDGEQFQQSNDPNTARACSKLLSQLKERIAAIRPVQAVVCKEDDIKLEVSESLCPQL